MSDTRFGSDAAIDAELESAPRRHWCAAPGPRWQLLTPEIDPPAARRQDGTGRIIMGLDLSLLNAGAVIVPANWGLRWRSIVRYTVGYPLPSMATIHEELERVDHIAYSLGEFAYRHGVTDVAIEDYSYSKGGRSSRAHALGELGGEVKRVMIRDGYRLSKATANVARVCLGKFPTRGPVKPKDAVRKVLYDAGSPIAWNEHEDDAFVQANHALSLMDNADAIILRQPDPPRAPRKRKARKCHYTKP